MLTTMQRLRVAVGLVLTVFVVGSVGYMALGMAPLDAIYQTVTTVTTVGFREMSEFGTAEKIFTMFVIVGGASTVLYSFTLAVQLVVEGQLGEFLGRRRMDRKIADLQGHVIVCGWGRVGKSAAHHLVESGTSVVIIDQDPERTREIPYPVVIGNATLDDTLRAAGVERASAVVAALQGDADNLFVTLSCRAMNPELFIVARARQEETVPKLEQAGADRVVNPQELGATRMASFIVQPNVAEFVDVVMHERSMEFRMQEVEVRAGSPLDGTSLHEADLRGRANVLVLALRRTDGSFVTNPDPELPLEAGQVVIAVGMDHDLARLVEVFKQ